MKPTITAFADSPDHGQGQARDMRVRWALEEVGQPYDVRLVPWKDFTKPAHKARQPFGQIPSYEEGDLTLFESGAIILHIADTRTGLFPRGAAARARAIMWMFAALNTIEPPVVEREAAQLLDSDKPWFRDRLAEIEARVHTRLTDLSARLGEAKWLDGAFSAGDLLMVTVLRRLDDAPIVAAYPNLAAYVARGEARPAYQRAFAAQHEVWLKAKAAASRG